MSKQAREYAQSRYERGLCCSCGNARLPDGYRCQSCLDKALQKQKDKAAAKQAAKPGNRTGRIAARNRAHAV